MMSGDEPGDMDVSRLSDAVCASDSLVIEGRVPMRRDNVEIGIVLEVQAFRTGDDLSKQDIRNITIDVLHAGGSGDASVNGADGEAAFGEHKGECIYLAMISAEDEFATKMSAFGYSLNNGSKFGRCRRSVFDLSIATRVLVELYVGIHKSGANTSLAATDQSRKSVGGQEGSGAGDSVSDMTTE